MGLLSKIFTWWDGATIGTHLFSMRKGEAVGSDALGNRYFQSRDGVKRWVIYDGPNDASRVPPEWHGWLHHTHDGRPEAYLPEPRAWEISATGNLTGTADAYKPAGALDVAQKRAAAKGDYEAWSPDAT